MKQESQRRAYTVREAATLFGVSPTARYRWVRTGAIRSTRIGRRVFIPASEIRRIDYGREEE